MTALAEGGKVLVPDPASAEWVRGWISEVAGFPQLREKDRADALAMALQRLREVRRPEDEFPFAMVEPEKRWYEGEEWYVPPAGQVREREEDRGWERLRW